jgi:DNA-binding PadR family transcriptional regulator
MFGHYFARRGRFGGGSGPFDPFGFGGQENWRGWGPFGGWGGSPGRRVDRGDVKFLILSVLKDGPKHGYEIMRAIEQRSEAAYTPSAGTIYPTLQMLEDLGYVKSQESNERKVYELTDSGRAYLAENEAAAKEAWGQFEGNPWRDLFSRFGSEDQRQLREEMMELARALFAGGRIFRANAATRARVRDILKTARQQIDAAFAEYV